MNLNEDTADRPLGTIMVATDFSAGANSALQCAIEVAKLHGAGVQLVHAVDAHRTIPSKLEVQVQRSLHKLEKLVHASGIDAESTHRMGKAWEVIATLERQIRPDLIVVGTRGHSPWSRISLGSHADRIIRVAESPVLAVHPDDAGSIFTIKNMVAGIDFSEESIMAVNVAARLLSRSPWDVRLVLLHAFHPPTDYSIGEAGAVSMVASVETEAEVNAQLERIAETLRSDRLTVEARAVYGYPVGVIEDEAKRLKANLVAVGTHGRSGLRHMFMGSVAERVIHHAPCPVLSVRHPEHARPGSRATMVEAVGEG